MRQTDARNFLGQPPFVREETTLQGKFALIPDELAAMPQLCPSDPGVSCEGSAFHGRARVFPAQSPGTVSWSPQPRQRWDSGHRQPQRWRQHLRSGCCVPGTSQALSHLTLAIIGRACNYTHFKNCDRKNPHNIKLPPSLFSHVQVSRACSHTHRTFTLL